MHLLITTFLLVLASTGPLLAQALNSEAVTAQRMEALKSDPLRLRNFLKAMPKGGDLHNHLSGAIYAESYLQWAMDEDDCINLKSLGISKRRPSHECAAGEQAAILISQQSPSIYQPLLEQMSMYQYLPERTHDTGHDHFFATFPRFAAVSFDHWGPMLAEVTERAARQHELYLELILGLDRDRARHYGTKAGWQNDLGAMHQQILAAGIRELIPQMRTWLDEGERQWKTKSACATEQPAAGCAVTTRYIYEVYRGLPKEQVFAQMVAGFELASVDPRVVAINLVMPEDWYVPMHDYDLHMRMMDFLHQRYPQVHITLHAGELAPGLVPYEGLCCHIRQAIELGHAERIGHGVDVMYEDQPEALLQEMADHHIPVEINLTSNRIILGVSGKEHPLRQYLRAGVPLVISTDDEGVSRSEMTEELIQAVIDQKMTYPELKQAERNSIQYSFADEATKKLLSDCLEKRFAAFERNDGGPLPACARH